MDKVEPGWKVLRNSLLVIPVLVASTFAALVSGVVFGWYRWHREVVRKLRKRDWMGALVFFMLGCAVFDAAILMFAKWAITGSGRLW